ncbi:MAG: phosphotransferase [Propionibacteriaceae bacterium]|nr:phosphotransferase [Propionibacteriaceae bacterium]
MVADGEELVVHRLHRRAVVRAAEGYRKVVRPGRAGAVASASGTLAEPCADAGIATAAVLGATDDTVTFATLPGRTLHELGAAGLSGWMAVAQAWPRLVRAVPEGGELGVHDAAREADTLLTWVGHAERFGAFGDRVRVLRAAAKSVAAELVAGRPDAEGVVHRDLHDKQVLWAAAGDTLGLLDLDTAARGEPALDLANLNAHVDLRVRQGVWSPATADAIASALAPIAGAVGASAERLGTYERSARLRLACVYAFRPGSQAWLESWLEDALAG